MLSPLMRRLHVQFYLAILATLAVFLVASAVFWTLTGNWRGEASGVSAAAQLAEGLLPPTAAPANEQQRSIENLHEQLRMSFALYGSTGRLLATAGGIPRLGRGKLYQTGWTLARGGPV